MKLQISLDDNLVKRIDNYADANYMTRSGFISLSCAQYLNQAEIIVSINDISLAMRKIADSGEIDDVTMAQLEDFERVCKMFTGK